MRECFNAERFPLAPAHNKTAAIEAAMPVQIVATSGLMNCIVSYIPKPAYTDPPGELT